MTAMQGLGRGEGSGGTTLQDPCHAPKEGGGMGRAGRKGREGREREEAENKEKAKKEDKVSAAVAGHDSGGCS